ncbi:hypothetical protein BDZ89DRAFT_1077375 [Hymenopellis radicata]|nr:hypothetical protein BDZ89DRAFT_1077375 [Hymenopellis radicata]
MTEAGPSSPTEDIGRPVKRPRLDNPSETPYNRDLEFWFPDGSIIIISQEGRGFCIHQGVLARHCEFFADMLLLARPERKASEGVQTLRLDDTTDDIRHFMHYLYTPCYFQIGLPHNYDRVSGLLRMSTKYLCHALRASVIQHLSLIYTVAHTALAKAVSLIPRTNTENHAFIAIQLGREHNVPQILPGAFYMACLIPPTRLPLLSPQLSPADERRLHIGRAQLTAAVVTRAWEWLHSQEFTGTSRCGNEHCLESRNKAVVRALRASYDAVAIYITEPPHRHGSITVGKEDVEEGQLCRPCWKKWEASEVAGYAEVWNSIPTYFDLTISTS